MQDHFYQIKRGFPTKYWGKPPRSPKRNWDAPGGHYVQKAKEAATAFPAVETPSFSFHMLGELYH